MTNDVRGRLPGEIAGQLSEDECEELARRLEVQDRLVIRLRGLSLREEEPSLAVALERER